MIKMNLRSHIKDATPEEVFAALADRDGLQDLMPRMRKVEFYDRQANSEKLVMHVSVGKSFGTIPCEGTLSWVEPRQITFQVQKPLPVEMQWTTQAAVNGTEIDIAMQLQLEPLLGPMAGFVPKQMVEEMIVKEMKHAIQNVALRVREQAAEKERAAAA
jgi:carbon monoxide dehydrogenase subunit G